MKPESLHALLIDRELGELSSDTVELLEAWLAEHPESAAAVSSIHRTLETTSATVRRFPELARPESNVSAFPAPRFRLIPLALAASVMILLGGTAWLGFRAGQESAQNAMAGNHRESVNTPSANAAKNAGPWARYALASAPRGGLTVVRRDINPQP
jgi:ferric-dicitrate binding protein FerR (iron transport regulator)